MIRIPEDPRQMEFICRADVVLEEPLVGLVDEVVDGLDLQKLYNRYSEGGCSFYDPAMQLKVLFFGYCDGVRSCRDLAKHIRYDIRYRYFCGSLRPDFRTINRFRKDNLDLLGCYFAQIVLLCQESGLLDWSLLALDGTKLRASASGRRRKRARDRLVRHFHGQLGADIVVDGSDDESDDDDATPPSDKGAVSTVDPDARFMKSSEGGKRLSYNSQVVVDKNQVIVAAEVSNNADDSVQFQPMMERCRQMIGCDLDKVTADGGYYSGNNLKYAVLEGIDLYLPVAKSGGKVPDDRFHRDEFIYSKSTDSYRCPAGQQLHYRTSRYRRGVRRRIYAGCASSCGCCRCRSQCTSGRYRMLEISDNYVYEQQMKAKLRSGPGRLVYRQRKSLVEPVFGNIKFNLGFVRFGLRTLDKVRGEFFLICIAHNLKKLAQYRRTLKPILTAQLAPVIIFPSFLALLRSIPSRFHHYQLYAVPNINVTIYSCEIC